MAVPPALVVTLTFDPPKVTIVGPIRQTTIAKLNATLPFLTRNVGSIRRDPPVFTTDQRRALNNWTLELKTQVTDEPSRIAFTLALLESLEEEGGWKMRDTHAGTDDFTETYTMFFTNKTMK